MRPIGRLQHSIVGPGRSGSTLVPTSHDEAGAGSRTYVRFRECGWEDVRDGCAAFLVFRAGSARTLTQ